MKIGRLIGALAVLAIGAVIGGYLMGKGEPEKAIALEEGGADSAPLAERESAPDFRLLDLNGEMLRFTDFGGKVVFLNFWATWCGPCRIEAPALQRLYERMAGKEFEILAVSLDARQERIAPFAEQYGLKFPLLWDQSKEVARLYAVEGIPVSILIDKRGKIVTRTPGAREWDSEVWVEHIEDLLKEE